MPNFAYTETGSVKETIVDRFMELYETTGEIKKLFISLLPKKSLLLNLMDIKSITEKRMACECLVDFLGENFLHTVGGSSEAKEKADQSETAKKAWRTMRRNEFSNRIYQMDYKDLDSDEQDEIDYKVKSRYPDTYEPKTVTKKKSNRKHFARNTIRKELLEQICRRHHNPEQKKKEILYEYKKTHYICPKDCKKKHKHLVEIDDFSDMVEDSHFSTKKWKLILTEKILQLPPVTAEPPPGEPKGANTVPLSKDVPIPPLRNYQTQSVIEIKEMLSDKDYKKRLLVNVPTGAGKTRLTVVGLIEWLNDRVQGKIPSAHERQKIGRVIFWFASTNELCEQACDEFEKIYSQMGQAGTIYLDRHFGDGRPKLVDILREFEGIHIVVTNTEHFQDFLEEEAAETKYYVDQFAESKYFEFIRDQTIAIIIDEAHDVTGKTYKRFLGGMGFDFSGGRSTISKKHGYDINRSNIVLLGLTATAYKGSGFRTDTKKSGEEEDDEFADLLKLTEKGQPAYFKDLDDATRKIHTIFDGVYVPVPQEGNESVSMPVAVIEAPISAYEGEHVKISGLKSFDFNSQIHYKWEILNVKQPSVVNDDDISEFHHHFKVAGSYQIKLTVTNENTSPRSISYTTSIDIYSAKAKKERTGSLEDNAEFYEVLRKGDILCDVIHGVIDGPHLDFNDKKLRKWKLGKLSLGDAEIVETNIEYNKHILEIISKCVQKYKKKRVLVFANGIKHAQELALILSVKYRLKAKHVDSNMQPRIRRKTIQEFKDGDIEVLCNHGILTTGFDVPLIDTLLICREVGSNALQTQMIGRGQRGTNSGGTPDLWLITSFLRKKNIDEAKLKLGWEVLAESWQKFPTEIKEDLGIRDNIPFDSKQTVKKSPKSEESDYIIKLEPLTIRCKTCKQERVGFENVMKFFDPVNNVPDAKKFVDESINNGTFPKHCIICRKISKLAKYSKCEFCESVADNHELDPTFVFIAAFAHHNQGKHTKFKDLQEFLFNAFEKSKPSSTFNSLNPTIRRFENIGLLEVKPNNDLIFKKISESDKLHEIISLLLEREEIKEQREKFEKDLHVIQKTSDEFKILLDELTKEFGHMPTKRQFKSKIEEKTMQKQFIQKYNGKYTKLLDTYRIILADDTDLKDRLYDEYFDLCIKLRKKASSKELDEFGQYKLRDYQDVFETFEKFEGKIKEYGTLDRVLKFYDEKKDDKTELKAIADDFKSVQNKIGRQPHFEEIYMHSKIRLFRYIIQLKISYLKYLKNYRGKETAKFLLLVKEFWRLKEILGITPTLDIFRNQTPANPTAYLLGLFESKYDKFLQTMNIEEPKEIPSEYADKMNKKTIEKLKNITEKANDGNVEVRSFIDSSKRKFDELSISISVWCNKKNLKEIFPLDSRSAKNEPTREKKNTKG